MKIAIIIEQPVDNGGGFQQSLNAIIEANLDKSDEFVIFVKDEKSANVLRQLSFKCEMLQFSRIEIQLLSLRRNLFFTTLFAKFSALNPFEKLLAKSAIELVYFVGPSTYALDCENLNFIFTVWDLCHLDYPEFPEVRQRREIEKREFLYKNTLQKAVAVICDSETGKKNIERIYNMNPERIFVNYFQPSPFIITSKSDRAILDTNKIAPGYLFYPAQFWAHKNHIYILDALKLNKEKGGKPIKVVFSGTDKGNSNYLKKIINDFGLTDDIFFVGFVPNEHLRTYYEFCSALVMPSYFGPTNIPPIEAIILNRPVLYSHMLTDELLKRTNNKELVFKIDLNNPMTMLEAIHSIQAKGSFESKINNLVEFESPLPIILKRYRAMSRLFLTSL